MQHTCSPSQVQSPAPKQPCFTEPLLRRRAPKINLNHQGKCPCRPYTLAKCQILRLWLCTQSSLIQFLIEPWPCTVDKTTLGSAHILFTKLTWPGFLTMSFRSVLTLQSSSCKRWVLAWGRSFSWRRRERGVGERGENWLRSRNRRLSRLLTFLTQTRTKLLTTMSWRWHFTAAHTPYTYAQFHPVALQATPYKVWLRGDYPTKSKDVACENSHIIMRMETHTYTLSVVVVTCGQVLKALCGQQSQVWLFTVLLPK